jgi:tetratricopeptide (TPR) repeat protein
VLNDRFKQAAVLVVVSAFLCLGCSSNRGAANGNSALDDAIALYIDKSYLQAVEAFNELIDRLDDDDDVMTAYLYLGRSYEALGDFVAAADAFSTGRLLGGGIQFEEHLASVQQHLRASPRSIELQRSITRAQLAALISRLQGRSTPAVVREAPDLEGHWASEYASALIANGIMEVMPDGNFHPDEAVTVAAFYAVLIRAGAVLGVTLDAIAAYFPGGMSGILSDGGSDRYIAGRDATEILQAFLAQTGS